MATITYPIGNRTGAVGRTFAPSVDGVPASNNTPNLAVIVFANTQTVLAPTRSFGTLIG